MVIAWGQSGFSESFSVLKPSRAVVFEGDTFGGHSDRTVGREGTCLASAQHGFDPRHPICFLNIPDSLSTAGHGPNEKKRKWRKGEERPERREGEGTEREGKGGELAAGSLKQQQVPGA